MRSRISAPDGTKKHDGKSVSVLREGTILSNGYSLSFLRADEHCITYKATKDGQFFLVKEVHPSDSEAVKALTNEQFLLEQFSHPGIQQCIERFRDDDWCYLVLEYTGGTSLDRIVSPNSLVFMGERLLLDWAIQLYDLFTYLHWEKNDGIYGDTLVKKVIRSPKNIVRDREGKIHLVDLGASIGGIDTLPQDEIALQQPLAAPEFYEGRDTDERSDVFTLGAIFYYLLTNGKGRSTKTGRYHTLGRINRNVSPELETIIMKALQSNPCDRFHSIEEMRTAHMAHKPSESEKKRIGGKGERPLMFRVLFPSACAALAAVLVLISFVTPGQKKRITRQSGETSVTAPDSVAISVAKGSNLAGSPGSADPVLHSGFRPPFEPSAPSTVPDAASEPSSVLPSAPATGAFPPSQALTPQIAPAPSMSIPAGYPTGIPHTMGRDSEISAAHPELSPEATGNNFQTKEERLATLLHMAVNDFEPAKSTYISLDNDYSATVPSGYFMIKKAGKNSAFFAALDEKNEESSLRMIHILTSFVPNIDQQAAVASNKISLINSGATVIDEKILFTNGGHSLTYKAYSFTYLFGPPPQFHVERNEYTHQDLFFAITRTQKAYRVKFCAPKESFEMYSRSEFENFLRSLHFTGTDDA